LTAVNVPRIVDPFAFALTDSERQLRRAGRVDRIILPFIGTNALMLVDTPALLLKKRLAPDMAFQVNVTFGSTSSASGVGDVIAARASNAVYV
jgi:hypothetical protein